MTQRYLSLCYATSRLTLLEVQTDRPSFSLCAAQLPITRPILLQVQPERPPFSLCSAQLLITRPTLLRVEPQRPSSSILPRSCAQREVGGASILDLQLIVFQFTEKLCHTNRGRGFAVTGPDRMFFCLWSALALSFLTCSRPPCIRIRCDVMSCPA